jgi:hypothetical protein
VDYQVEAEVLVAEAWAGSQRRFLDGTRRVGLTAQDILGMDQGTPGHEDNTRCDWLAQNAAATQRSSWADGRPHATLRLALGADYVPPKPQADIFADVEHGGEDDEDDEEAVLNTG